MIASRGNMLYCKAYLYSKEISRKRQWIMMSPHIPILSRPFKSLILA